MDFIARSNFRRWAALVVVCFGQLMIVLDSTIVNVALPSIQRDLHLTQTNLTWVVNAYLIAYGSFLLVAGRAGDLIGRRKVFLAGVFLFTASSIAIGLSHGAEGLVVGRFVQGLGAAMSAGVILAIIISEFTRPEERAQAMSVFTFTIAGGGSIGLLAGGLLTQYVNWHWIFFINGPIGLVTLVLGAWLVRENMGLGLGHGVDLAGAALITSAVTLGVYAIVTAGDAGWTSAHTLGLGATALALLAAFVAVEQRISNPLMPMRMIRLRSLSGANAVRGFVFAGMFTNFFVGSLYLQHVRGMDAVGVGLAFLPTTLAIGMMSAGITARLMRRFGPRRLAGLGLLGIIAALLLLSGADGATSYFPQIFGAYLMMGLGGGTAFMPLLTISMSEVPPADAGLASGYGTLSMQIGGALGLAALGTISSAHAASLLAHGASVSSALTGGYRLAWLLAASIVTVGLALMTAVLRPATVRKLHTADEAIEAVEVEAA